MYTMYIEGVQLRSQIIQRMFKMSNYTKSAIRSNLFASTLITLESLIGVETIEELWSNTMEVGDHFYSLPIKELYELTEVKEHLTTTMNLTKKEIINVDFVNVTRQVMADAYRDLYQSELYDKYFNHVETQLQGRKYHFENAEGDIVHFTEAKYIRVGLTKNEFKELTYNDYRDDYDTNAEFYDDNEFILNDYLHYNTETFDNDYYNHYCGVFVESENWMYHLSECELVCDIVSDRKHHQSKLKNLIKHRVPLDYRIAC
jgi:hypothetical protein